MNTTDLKNRFYRLTEDTAKNMRAAEMMSKLIGCECIVDDETWMDYIATFDAYLVYSVNRHWIFASLEIPQTSTEISYSELEGLYKEQYWFDASVEDAKYEDGKNAEDN